MKPLGALRRKGAYAPVGLAGIFSAFTSHKKLLTTQRAVADLFHSAHSQKSPAEAGQFGKKGSSMGSCRQELR